MNTGPDASRATKFTYLLSCFANELVHRRLGVFCTVFTSVYLGKWYILRRHARGNQARILDQMASRAKKKYLFSCIPSGRAELGGL